jgi:hypothetical protein
MTYRTFSKRATIASLFIGVLLAGSIAFAWWSATGTGNGYAKATTPAALTTVDVSTSASAQLYPGGTGDLIVKIHNPNPYAITVTSIAATGATPRAVSGNATCDAADSVYLIATLSGLSINVPAGGDSSLQTFTNAVKMDGPSAVDACQGKTFAVPVTLTGTSA